MLEHEHAWHLAKATLLAGIATLLLTFQQARHAFHQTRTAFVDFQRERHRARREAAAKQIKQDGKQGKRGVRAPVAELEGGEDEGTFVVAFFHPRCADGGGGERVLWKAIQALGELKEAAVAASNGGPPRRAKTRRDGVAINEDAGATRRDAARRANCRNVSVVVYTIDAPSVDYEKEVLAKVRERFSITLPASLSVHFVHLHEVKDLLDKPARFTMIAESWGSMKLTWHALSAVTPHVFIDTTGCAFTFFVAKVLAGCKVGAYVHYPTISTDMLSLVWERRPSYNNTAQIATNPLITYAKLLYYAAFAVCYGMVGSLADLTMVNSSWTQGHIQYMWKLAGKIRIVFPPVNTKNLRELPIANREQMIVSIGQFRPEKDHALQLRAFAELLNMDGGALRRAGVQLALIGGCRGEDDRARVDQLQNLARELGVADEVAFVLNQPYSVLKEYLRRASVGIHTMWNEHFGIGVVEMMAAGLVMVAHDSGGPKSDIILRPWDFNAAATADGDAPTGCLASTAEGYAAALHAVLRRDAEAVDVLELRKHGRHAAERFSDEVFLASFKDAVMPLFETRRHWVFRWQE